jgi:S-adenosylmethionine:tRNA ribosyltransferase-isomerase
VGVERGVVIAASAPRADPSKERLLVVDPASGRVIDAVMADLPSLLGAGDAVIVNDAATLPASLRLLDGRELRLVGHVSASVFCGVLFGAGDHRTPTEHRPEPALARVHDVLHFGAGLWATVLNVDPASRGTESRRARRLPGA